MIEKEYIDLAQKIVRKHCPQNKAFIFGSSLREKRFYDIDIAIQGLKDHSIIWDIKESFEESNFPRVVDVVDFDHTDKNFQKYVLDKEVKQWI